LSFTLFECIFVIYIKYFPYCLFVSNSQVIRCDDRLWNDLYCVGWGVKLLNPIHSRAVRNEHGPCSCTALNILSSLISGFFCVKASLPVGPEQSPHSYAIVHSSNDVSRRSLTSRKMEKALFTLPTPWIRVKPILTECACRLTIWVTLPDGKKLSTDHL